MYCKRLTWSSYLKYGTLIALAILFCYSALRAPFWNDNDTWSNLLPIIQYRQSILHFHTFPLFTSLWYGGRFQWMNPLWNFLYPPATFVWLIFPLDWGTRIVFAGHLIFALIAGERLASIFLTEETDRVAASIILVSPMLSGMTAGHVEKVLAWPWILSALYLLHNENLPSVKRGLGAGTCWGLMALAGANYYVFYAGILLIPLLVTLNDRKLWIAFSGGASVGLLHIPSVFYLLGQDRANPVQSISYYSSSLTGIINSLTLGLGKPFNPESWGLIGAPAMLLFILILGHQIKNLLERGLVAKTGWGLAVFTSLTLLILLATGRAYSLNRALSTFRLPVRAIAFIALGISLYILHEFQGLLREYAGGMTLVARGLLACSALEICLLAWFIRPLGANHSPEDKGAMHIAELLKTDKAKSVWFSTQQLGDMYIDAALMQNDINLPNVYYGDMGQTVPIRGEFCGYSFDHLISPPPSEDQKTISLKSDLFWSPTTEYIVTAKLLLVQRVLLDGREYGIYRVSCNNVFQGAATN